jgi:exopolyphosphatase/guanosine-5'-triphosphate,3'-diphosphate pyrophosphatase
VNAAGERRIAAIDVGTNSVHVVVARATPRGPLDILAREKVKVRLGSGGRDMKELDPAAVDRAIEAIGRFAGIAEAHDAEVVALATSAVRESEDPTAFIARVEARTGVRVEVISGPEEARLIHLGALSTVPAGSGRHLVIDIGGGSTEVIVGADGVPTLTRSFKLGHIRLTDGFLPKGKASAAAVAALREYVSSFLAGPSMEFVQIGHDEAVGCSGTIENVAAIAAHLEGRTFTTVDNLSLTRDGVGAVVDLVVSHRRANDRRGIAGLDDNRADVIVAGAVLLEELFRALRIDEMVVSTGALREGVVLDRLHRRAGPAVEALHHLGDLRRRSVLAVAERYEEDVEHAERATDLALELFDETAPLHGLGEPEREILEAAGFLHNIGRFVAHAAHHKHSAYLIRNAEQLVGFTEQEKALIAQVARYHRKSAPRARRHPEFAALTGAEQDTVRVLAGLLRVGIGLDRTYRRVVTAVSASADDDVLTVTVEALPGADADLELYSARERGSLLAAALDRRIEIVAG